MKTLWLCGLTVSCAAGAFAQPAPPAAQGPASLTPATMSITGCVTGGSDSRPITLTNAMVLPTGSAAVQPDTVAAAPSASPSPDRSAVSATPTQPEATNPASPTAGATSSVGTVGAGSATAGTSGTI